MKTGKYLITAGCILMGLTASAANNLIFGYGSEFSKGIGTGTVGEIVGGAIEIPAALAQKYAGNYVGGVRIGFGESSNKEITLFITKDLNETPFYSLGAEITVANGWNQVSLKSPWLIDGETFYVGYQTEQKAVTDTPLGVTNSPVADSYGDFIGENGVWNHFGKFYGNLCIELLLTGDNLPQYEAEITNLIAPAFVIQNMPFEATVKVENDGAEPVKSLSFLVKANNSNIDMPTIELAEAIPSGRSQNVVIENIISNVIATDMPLEISIKEVNGHPNGLASTSGMTTNFSCSETGFHRNVVVEEFTGTWCGWCPLGIVGMDYMKDNYGDEGFIGIAIHSGDEMADNSFEPVLEAFCNNLYPGCIVNRTYTMEPYAENLEEYFLIESKDPTYASVELKASYSESDKSIKLSSSTEFSLDIFEADYSLAFVLTENNIGPFSQTNYFAGGAYGEMDGWEKEGAKVPTYYNEVGRIIDNPFGIERSLPSVIKKGQIYSYNYEIPAEYAENIEECEVVALILDGETKGIVNAAKTKIGKEAGIEQLAQDNANGDLKIFTLQGLPVKGADINRIPSGIYIINGKKKVVR